MAENTVERIAEICKEKGIAISKVERDLGFGNSSLNPEKTSDIKASRLFKVLNYLGVSFNEFYGIPAEPIYKEKNPAATEGSGDNPHSYNEREDIKRLVDRLTDDEVHHYYESIKNTILGQ